MYSNVGPVRADAVLLVMVHGLRSMSHSKPTKCKLLVIIFRIKHNLYSVAAGVRHTYRRQPTPSSSNLQGCCHPAVRGHASSDDQCMQATLLSMYSNDIHG